MKSDIESGATIFDSNIINVLGEKVKPQSVSLTKKRLSLPFWSSKSQTMPVKSLFNEKIIISHEVLGSNCENLKNYIFIVHNYFPAITGSISFHLKLYYKLGSKSYFNKIFKNASKIIFISWHDFEAANLDFPIYSYKFKLIQPGYIRKFNYPFNNRVSKFINNPGSNDWFLKKHALKKFLSLNIDNCIFSNEFDNSNFISVICDNFNVGFKLKLIELAQSFQRIISFVDIKSELDKMGLDVDVIIVNDKKSFITAYHNFLLKGDYTLSEKNRISEKIKNYSWEKFGDILDE